MTAFGRDVGGAPAGAATITGMFAGAELTAGEIVAGRFRIEGLIGIGGMGVVYRAYDQQLGVDVALKLLRPELASRPEAFARFRQEILLARQVSSPHVVRIHDLVADGARWLISMDFVPGASLEKVLDDQGRLGFDDTIKIARQLALGLAAAHQRGVIHRDLKPANILVTETLDAYVSDFGVARSAGATGVTGAGVVVGTPEYLSPEQARAETVDARSDLYALGLIVYEMLTGKLPFPEGTPAELLAQRIVKSPALVSKARPETPAWIVRLVAKLLQLRASRRFQSALDVVSAIDARRVSLPDARSAWIAAATALGLIGGGLFVSQRETPVPEREGSVRPPRSTTPLPAPAPLLVLPFAPNAPADAALAAAIGELLGETLLGDGVASLDSGRANRLLRQLGYDAAAAERNVARVLESGGATRALGGALERADGRYRLTLRRIEPRTPRAAREITSGTVTLDALPEAATQLIDALGLRGTVPAARATPAWPRSEAALVAFGEGVLARASYDEAAAVAAFARAVAADPGFALAWRLRLDLLDRMRSPELAGTAAAARTALRGGTGRAADTVRAYGELLEGDARAAADRLAPLAAAAPHDHTLALLYARALEDAGDDAPAQRERERVAAADPFNADAWLTLGRAAVRGGDAQKGVDDFLIRAQVLFTRQADARGLADTANALGIGYERLGQLAAAAEHFGRAAEARERLGDALGGARARRNLAAVQMVRGELDAAAAELAQARQLLGNDADPAAVAGLANDEGLLAEERGDFRAALSAYREALELRQRAGDTNLVIESLINVGFAYYHIGEFDNAATYFAQAGDAARAAGDLPSRVRAEQSQGLLLTARGDWAKARELLDASLATAEAQQMSEERSISLLYLADLDRLEGRLDPALARLDEAEKQFTAREDRRAIVEAKLVRAAALLDVGAWDRAAATLAPDAIGEPGSREQAALLAVRRGELALGRGDVAAARTASAAAIVAVGEAHSVPATIQSATLALRLTGRGNDREQARRGAATLLAMLKTFPALALELSAREAAIAATRDASHYDAALAPLERVPRYVGAWRVHAAGADARRRADRRADAEEAERAAAAARTELAGGLSPALRAALEGYERDSVGTVK